MPLANQQRFDNNFTRRLNEIIEINLTEEEKAALAHSVDAVRKTCGEVDAMSKK